MAERSLLTPEEIGNTVISVATAKDALYALSQVLAVLRCAGEAPCDHDREHALDLAIGIFAVELAKVRTFLYKEVFFSPIEESAI